MRIKFSFRGKKTVEKTNTAKSYGEAVCISTTAAEGSHATEGCPRVGAAQSS